MNNYEITINQIKRFESLRSVKEFKSRISKIPRCYFSCVSIEKELGFYWRILYANELRLDDYAHWIDHFLTGNRLPYLDYNDQEEMLRDFLLGMFQDFVINHTDLLELEK